MLASQKIVEESNRDYNKVGTVVMEEFSFSSQDMGPHIFQTCPSANYFDCKAMSIGARSQSARTYLERLMDTFQDCEYGDGNDLEV